MPGPQPKYQVELTESQVKEFSELSRCYSAPFGEVQRARILLLAHQSPEMSNAAIAREVGCAVDTVRVWRKRWQSNQSLKDLPRPGARRTFSSSQRAQITALACTRPADHGKTFKRWNAEKLTAVAIEKKIVTEISSATVRTWLREEKINPWRYHLRFAHLQPGFWN
jgi:transposase